MRSLRSLAAVGLALVFLGCGGDAAGPGSADDGISLVPDFAESMASSVDGGGIGASNLPEELRLTTEQKAAIAALHEAFKAATAADVAALRALEAEARAAHDAGKSREEIHAILVRGVPIVARLAAAFARLQHDIWQVYTPEQRAWIEAHRPKPCGPAGPPPLTDQQIQQIRALQQAFMQAVHDDVELIKQVAEAARAAHQSGATRDQIEAILHQADAARARLREAEVRLQAAIDAVLTPEQRAKRCVPAHRP